MIGNIDYIIDNVSKATGEDRAIVEAVAMETFKRWKKEITNTETLSIYVPKLGHWVGMNRKLRGYLRQYIKKLRRIREKIASGNVPPEKMEGYLMMENVYKNNISRAWIQLDAMRLVIVRGKELSKARKIRRDLKYGHLDRIPETNT